ncbi:hypothetical protein COLO4_02724 [Corchorus olitorius]|uniref:Uncharacterized protein n=1 Tax=Corchorus olitorius TaxID=93759 RepID=A0A1R3L0J6_9ROSI|nr:hypothetical protein COLO4_02724 [Corchorus olitorius]
MSADPLLNIVDKDLESAPTIEDDVEDENITVVKVTNEWTNFRDELAVKMFEEYRRRETHFQNLALFRPINRRSSRSYIGECRQRSISIRKLAQGFAAMEKDTDDNAIREESGAVDRSLLMEALR